MTLVAIQQDNGNFTVVDSNGSGVHAAIVNVSGSLWPNAVWRVMSRTAGRKNSRTGSPTPEEAARKYYGRKITFQYVVGDAR